MKFLEIVLTILVVAKFVEAQSDGDPCTVVKTGQVGSCLHISKCPVVLAAAYENISPQICRIAGTVPIVCCPRVSVLEGSNCTLNDTRPGVCRPFTNCTRAVRAALRGVVPQKCDLTDNESELVCCAETVLLPNNCPLLPKGFVTQIPVGSKAADYCIGLAEKIHPCQQTGSGWTRGDICPLLTPDSDIVYYNTPMTTSAEAPFLGQIGIGQRGDISWQGYHVSLVSDQWVLCSARAITNLGSSNDKFVGLGGTITPQYNPDEIIGVTKRLVHPLHNQSYSYVYNNIALLQLERRVIFTARIIPACLHTGTSLPDSGFIQTNYPGRKTTMQRLSQEECSRVVPTTSYDHPAGVKHEQEICSRPVNPVGGCLGWYTGSPLTLNNSHRIACTHLLVGLLSSGVFSPCIVIDIRISSFIPWIEGIVWPESA